jgi:class 3 adenylate cyclase/tetratricopeptide (TPR) repeat protein
MTVDLDRAVGRFEAAAVECPQCGRRNRAEARFCDGCGQPLTAPARESVTPEHLAKKIRRQRPSEGERRIVTVLFVDTVGSTPLAEKLGEEAMYSLMRQALARMSDAVHHYEGYVATFTGDGLMALFGAPIAHEDSARRAVAAALRMQTSLEEYGADIERRHGVGCRFRIGLNTGPVVVGTVADDLRMDFTAIGDTVNLAARMEQNAEPGTVLISEPTHRAVADFFDCEALGDLALKGKAEPAPAWRVVRDKGMRTRFQAAAERGLSPLVGRDRELAVLIEQAERAAGREGRVVFIAGEAGIGKSRLLLELRRRLGTESFRWLEGRCVSYGCNFPYMPVVDLLKAVFGVAEDDDEGRIIARVDEAVAHWDEQAQKRAPYLKHLLSVDPGDETVATMDPQERHLDTLDALGDLLVEESRQRPLVVVVEDLHWADQMSLEALGTLRGVVPTVPVLLLLTHRLDYQPPPDQTALSVARLDSEASAALTRGVLDAQALPADIEQLVTGKAEGNPFYIEEVTKALVEAGVLERVEATGYRLGRAIDQVEIPGTIQEVILSRIDRLEREAKEAMQLASVVGREFTARVLDRISDLEAQLSDVLGELTALELIFEKERFPELAYMFKHALVHDVAYATLLGERRRALHRLVGTAIEELYGDRLAEQYETLAHHYSEGHEWAKALDYVEKAGDKAAAAFANRDALGFYARALEVCERLGDQAVATSASLAAKRGFVNYAIGDVAGAIADFDRMVDIARVLGDRSLEGTALSSRAFMEFLNLEFAKVEATAAEALAIVEEGFEEVRPLANLALGGVICVTKRYAVKEIEPILISEAQLAALADPFLQGTWSWILGCNHTWRGEADATIRLLRSLPETANLIITNRLWNWWTEAVALGTVGEYEAALRLLGDTIRTGERVGDVPVQGRALNTVGWIYTQLHDHVRALDWNRRSLEFVQSHPEFPEPDIHMNARLNMAIDLMAMERPDEAEKEFRVVEAVAEGPLPDSFAFWRYSQRLYHSYGELWLTRGDLGRAADYAERCLELAEGNMSRKYIAQGRRLRAQVLMAQGQVEEAQQDLSVALELAREVGNPPQLWETQAAIGDLRRAQGRPEEAGEAYANAFSVIDTVAGSLTDDDLRSTFLESKRVEAIRRAAASPAG